MGKAFARPCVGCGYCCKTAVCVVGQIFLKTGPHPPCPGLEHNGERYRCKIAEEHGEELAIGAGCCSPLNSERQIMIRREARDDECRQFVDAK